MSVEQDADGPVAKPRFRRSRPMAKMPPENAKRQGAIAALAFTSFGDRDRALDFLNSHHHAIDARPLDVASDSAEGYELVSKLIAGSTC